VPALHGDEWLKNYAQTVRGLVTLSWPALPGLGVNLMPERIYSRANGLAAPSVLTRLWRSSMEKSLIPPAEAHSMSMASLKALNVHMTA